MTTDYLTFSDPKALRVLAGFKNIELRMFATENSREGFHTKGYIFKKGEMYRIIVGSSNMTRIGNAEKTFDISAWYNGRIKAVLA